jgi:cell division protein FtsA
MLASLKYQSVKGRRNSVAVLDIGSSKISCFIAEPDEHEALRIIGIGHTHAQGFRGGVITDSRAAETSIISAVNLAEQMAGVTLDNVMVNLSLPNIHSHSRNIELNIAGNEVTDKDISDILQEGCKSVARTDREIIHCIVTQYQLDGAKNIRDPRNMYGMVLKADVHVISVNNSVLFNLSNTLSRCHLDIAEFVAAPYMSAYGCSEADERDLGVVVIDIGATETNIALFANGANVYSGCIPIGGHHVTKDLAHCLSMSVTHAERIKTLHGGVYASAQDSAHNIHIPRIGEEEDSSDDDAYISRADLVNIIHPRMEELCDMIHTQIESAHQKQFIGLPIILTGGGAQLMGVREMMADAFGAKVRIGKPKFFSGLADSVSGTPFSSSVGMLYYIMSRPFEDGLLRNCTTSHARDNFVERTWQWLKKSF